MTIALVNHYVVFPYIQVSTTDLQMKYYLIFWTVKLRYCKGVVKHHKVGGLCHALDTHYSVPPSRCTLFKNLTMLTEKKYHYTTKS